MTTLNATFLFSVDINRRHRRRYAKQTTIFFECIILIAMIR